MTTDEKLLNIIISVKKIYKHFFYDEFEEVDWLISKVNKLLDETIIDNIGYLKNINTEIFTDEKYFSESFRNNKYRESFRNNKYRKYIEKNINNVKCKNIKFNYDLIIKYIEEDYEIFNYIHLSDFAKNSVELAKYVLNINPKLLVYTGNDIKNNKEIMLKMIELDSSNTYYLSEQLKEELGF